MYDKLIKFVLILFIIWSFLFFLLFKVFTPLFAQNNDLKHIQDDNSEENGKYTAIIVEPRKHPAFEFVLLNFTKNLDNRWNFIIFHGNNNESYVKNIINKKMKNELSRIQYINLNVDNLSIQDYNNLLFSKDFYEKIPTETFLIFQTDSMISKKYKNNIYEFIEYDYVGAPWTIRDDFTSQQVGNGGLSLRKKSKMLEILNNYSPIQNINEDVFFSLLCKKVNLYKPSFKKAKRFSIESVYHDCSFGLHKPWLSFPKETIEEINEFCPGLIELIYLNHLPIIP